MNKAIIDSIEWHKDQLFKLLEDDDLVKMEGSIQSVKSDLNEIIEKAKSKKRVWVKPTATKKGHYREQEVGRKESDKGSIKVSDKVISTLERERTHKLDSGTGDVDAGMAHGIQYVLNTIKDSKNNTLSVGDVKELKGALIMRLDNPDSDYHVGEGHGIRFGLTELGVRT